MEPMKKLDEIQKYLKDKREIYTKIITAIDTAIEGGAEKILIKQISLMDSIVDAFANREDWPNCLEKARNFFEGMEDYEACQRCKDLLAKLQKTSN